MKEKSHPKEVQQYNSRFNLEATTYMGEVNVRYARKTGVKDNFRLLAQGRGGTEVSCT